MKLGIDVWTHSKGRLIHRLKGLKTTEAVCDGGEYHEDRNLSQVWLTTSWTEKELDDWLYRTTGIDCIGTFTREEEPC